MSQSLDFGGVIRSRFRGGHGAGARFIENSSRFRVLGKHFFHPFNQACIALVVLGQALLKLGPAPKPGWAWTGESGELLIKEPARATAHCVTGC